MFITTRAESEFDMQVENLDFHTEAAEQVITFQPYPVTNAAIVQAEHALGPFPEDRPGMPSYLRSYMIPFGRHQVPVY